MQDLLQSKRKRKFMLRVGFEPAFLSCTRSETCSPLVWKVSCYWINYMSTVIRENRKRRSHFLTNPVHPSYCARAVAKVQSARDYMFVWCFVYWEYSLASVSVWDNPEGESWHFTALTYWFHRSFRSHWSVFHSGDFMIRIRDDSSCSLDRIPAIPTVHPLPVNPSEFWTGIVKRATAASWHSSMLNINLPYVCRFCRALLLWYIVVYCTNKHAKQFQHVAMQPSQVKDLVRRYLGWCNRDGGWGGGKCPFSIFPT
jgi:hypothetical protein